MGAFTTKSKRKLPVLGGPRAVIGRVLKWSFPVGFPEAISRTSPSKQTTRTTDPQGGPHHCNLPPLDVFESCWRGATFFFFLGCSRPDGSARKLFSGKVMSLESTLQAERAKRLKPGMGPLLQVARRETAGLPARGWCFCLKMRLPFLGSKAKGYQRTPSILQAPIQPKLPLETSRQRGKLASKSGERTTQTLRLAGAYPT